MRSNSNRFGVLKFSVATAIISATCRPLAAQTIVEDWGDNSYGELGNGTTNISAVPVAVSGMSGGIGGVAGGCLHSLALRNGGAYAWGYNPYGQLGNGTTSGQTGANPNPVAVSNLSSGVTAVAAGELHSLAIQNCGVYAWGNNDYGQLGNHSTTTSSVPVPVNNLSTGVTAIAGGFLYSMAMQNGSVYAWGYNGVGQLGNNSTSNSSVPVQVTGLSNGVTAIAAGYVNSLAIRNGGVYAWGDNGAGELGNGTTGNSSVPLAVPTLSSGVTAIAAGKWYSLAVQNGSVYAWGYNNDGQLGDGTITNHLTPEPVDPAVMTNIIAVASDSNGLTSYALSSDGSIWDWGLNSFGNLGLGNTTSEYLTPQHLLPLEGYYFTAISANSYGAIAVLSSTPVPEPTSLMLLGLASLGLLRRRR